MSPHITNQILKATNSTVITKVENIQELWSGYGHLSRIFLDNQENKTVILKHVQIPKKISHPKGFANHFSNQRKIKSYQVETAWYQNYNDLNLQDKNSRTPQCLACFNQENEFFILLEDLCTSGFSNKITEVKLKNIRTVLSWLASFHAKFMHTKASPLWKQGTYWHLQTRPDELKVLEKEDLKLARMASLIDQKLQNSQYQTLIHGDAKLDNFCFSKDLSQVAAVDFQYVGHGCGMKDVAYFMGSCLNEDDCEKYEGAILDHYFEKLSQHFKGDSKEFNELEKEWRKLFPFAWADFHRFLKGWSPGHWKINSYSEKITLKASKQIINELLDTSKTACEEAGRIISSHWRKSFKTSKKNGHTASAQIVTEVDHLSQEKIIELLQASIKQYNLGLLAEEDNDNGSRLDKDYFWAIDPLDGTLPFSEGNTGFAVTVALISKKGNPFIGVVYDPVEEKTYHAIEDNGVFLNNQPLTGKTKATSEKIQLFADRSLKDEPCFSKMEQAFDIHFIGGAVTNALKVLTSDKSCYLKFPKNRTGGCAIWDLAATSLFLKESGGEMTDFYGSPLSFNSSDDIYFNQKGLLARSGDLSFEEIKALLRFET